MPQGPRSKQISDSLADARKRREEAARLREEEAKKKAAADLARKDEVRTTKITNRRGRQTGTGYEKWDGKKWVKINKAEYDKLKKGKTAPVKETPSSPSAETKPSNAPPAVPPPPPELTYSPSDGMIRLAWDDRAERHVNPLDPNIRSSRMDLFIRCFLE